MTKQTEALKLALEAICGSGEFLFNWHDCEPNNEREIQSYQATLADNEKAFTALREALADQCVCGEPDTFGTHRTDGPCLAEQPAQQEPVAWVHLESWVTGKYWPDDCFSALPIDEWQPLYTSPPAQRTWVGLTDEDIDIAFDDTQEGGGFDDFARAIEAKLKEKNT